MTLGGEVVTGMEEMSCMSKTPGNAPSVHVDVDAMAQTTVWGKAQVGVRGCGFSGENRWTCPDTWHHCCSLKSSRLEASPDLASDESNKQRSASMPKC